MKIVEEERKPHIGIETMVPKIKYSGPHKRGVDVADFYGFHLLKPIRVEKDDRSVLQENDEFPVDRVALIRRYLERGFDACTQPISVAYTSKIPYKPEVHLRLEVLGTNKSVADILLIHTSLTVLRELGFKDLSLSINSTGGRESFTPFIRELTAYYRKNFNDLDECCMEGFKNDVFAPLRCNNERCVKLREEAPQPVAFLTEQSRKHFYEILESLDGLSVPYSINHHLVGHKDFSSRTVFAINTKDKDGNKVPLAKGERYDYLARKAGFGRNIPAVGVSIETSGLRASSNTEERFREYKIKSGSPKAFIVHLGLDAKRVVLSLTENLREARIPVATSFAEDDLRNQLARADELQTPAIVIIGQKEVLDGTAMVRRRSTRAQTVVPQKSLVTYLRRIC